MFYIAAKDIMILFETKKLYLRSFNNKKFQCKAESLMESKMF